MLVLSRPAPVVAHAAWRQAHDKIHALLQAHAPLVAILGPPGAGKTTLLRSLEVALQPLNPITHVSETTDLAAELPPNSIVLIDEAERLNPARLETLATSQDLTVILTALPPFHRRLLELPEAVVVPLPLLTDDEAMPFLAAWMAEFDLPLTAVAPDAWHRLITHCKGVPRLLASLLKLALFIAADESAPCISPEHVQTAIAVQNGTAEINLAQLAGLSLANTASEPAPEPPPKPTSTRAEPAPEPTPPHRPPPRRTHQFAWFASAALALTALAFTLAWSRHQPPESAIIQGVSAATPTVAPATLPPGASVRIEMIYPWGNTAALHHSLDLGHTLRANGFSVSDPFPVPLANLNPGVRYYFIQDQGTAQAINDLLGGRYPPASLDQSPQLEWLRRPGTIAIAVAQD